MLNDSLFFLALVCAGIFVAVLLNETMPHQVITDGTVLMDDIQFYP